MENVHKEYNVYGKKYRLYKLFDVVFCVSLLILLSVIFFVPTIKINVGSQQLFSASVLGKISESEELSTEFANYLIKNTKYYEEYIAYTANVSDKTISIGSWCFIIIKDLFGASHVFHVDMLGAMSQIAAFAIIIGYFAICIYLLGVAIGDILLLIDDKEIAKICSLSGSELSSSKSINILKLFRVRNCLIFTVLLLLPLLINFYAFIAQQPGTFAGNCFSASVFLYFNFSNLFYILPILWCILMYIFTVVSTKLNPFFY